MNPARYRLGVDVGGTHTDLVLLDTTTGELLVEKVSSTPKKLLLPEFRAPTIAITCPLASPLATLSGRKMWQCGHTKVFTDVQ